MKNQKVLSLSALIHKIHTLRSKGLKIVFTNGCFDLLHIGHLDVIERAKKEGDILVIGLNTDRSVRMLKGSQRPIVSFKDRARILAALESVDLVTGFNSRTPLHLIRKISPDVLIKGGDYDIGSIVGARDVLERGGRVKIVPLVKNKSSTLMIQKLKDLQSC